MGVLPLFGFEATEPVAKTSALRSLHRFSDKYPRNYTVHATYQSVTAVAQPHGIIEAMSLGDLPASASNAIAIRFSFPIYLCFFPFPSTFGLDFHGRPRFRVSFLGVTCVSFFLPM